MDDLQQTLASLKEGDWVIAEFKRGEAKITVEGKCSHSGANSDLWVGTVQNVLRSADGEQDRHLTSLTHIPAPMPEEPPAGTVILDPVTIDAFQRVFEGAENDMNWRGIGSGMPFAWSEIYRGAVTIYDPREAGK